MKNMMKQVLATTIVAATTAFYAANAATLPGFVDFGKFTMPASGGDFVEVNIRQNLIAMTAKLFEKQQPDVADLMKDVKGIHVNVIGLQEDNRKEVVQRIEAIRARVDKEGWEQIVAVQKDKDNVRVSMKTKGDEAVEGVVVTIIGADKQAVLVNVVGNIRPDKIALLGEKLNIEPLKRAGQAITKP